MKVKLNNVRLSFPRLFVPEQYQGTGPLRYSGTFLIEPGSENDKAIREAIKAAAEDKFGSKAAANLKAFEAAGSQKYCYLDGNTKTTDGYQDMWYITANRKEKDGPPVVVDKDKSALTETSGKPYAGCYVNAVIEIYAQTKDTPGIRAQLAAVQFAGDGEAFAGAPATANDFEDISEGADNMGFA